MKRKFIRIKVVFKPAKRMHDFINQCYEIFGHMSQDKRFMNHNVPYREIRTEIDELVTADIIAKSRAAGTVTERDKKKDKVYYRFCWLQYFVQDLADNMEKEKDARELVDASGFFIKKSSVYLRPYFSIKQDRNSGNIILRTKSFGKLAVYEWQISKNHCLTFEMLPPTRVARMVISNATPYEKLFFRFRAITKTETTEWSQPVSIIPVAPDETVCQPIKIY